MDKADYGALVNLANKSRRVKSYDYFNFTNAARGNGAKKDTTAGLTKVSKKLLVFLTLSRSATLPVVMSPRQHTNGGCHRWRHQRHRYFDRYW